MKCIRPAMLVNTATCAGRLGRRKREWNSENPTSKSLTRHTSPHGSIVGGNIWLPQREGNGWMGMLKCMLPSVSRTGTARAIWGNFLLLITNKAVVSTFLAPSLCCPWARIVSICCQLHQSCSSHSCRSLWNLCKMFLLILYVSC